jgi:electron transfer flavoprotein alpha subunit
MSNYIVLVKQVPDVTQITDNAFDPDTGTLIRTRLTSVINELDAEALAFANYMRKISGKEGWIVVLSMGPPMADAVLRYSLSRCADTAVLLTDRNLGGADTVATANPLAFAVRKIVKEVFDGDKDYFVICGMQSVDGDTAQVPPQIAEELGFGCIAYVTSAEFKNGRFEFTRIISGGSQTVSPKRVPAVITVAKYEYPLFASFARSRSANRMQIIQWSADDIKAEQIGTAGSKTSVIRVFAPGKSRRKRRHLATVPELADAITDSFQARDKRETKKVQTRKTDYLLPQKRTDIFDRSFEGIQKENDDFKVLKDVLKKLGIGSVEQINEYVRGEILAAAGERFHTKALDDMLTGLKLSEPSYKGEVWVVAEHNNKEIHPATFELLGKARELAESLDTKVGVSLAGKKVEQFAKDLITAGTDNVYIIEDNLLSEFDPAVYCKAVADCIEANLPQIVLFAATPWGRVLAPMVSYRLGCGLTADCTGLDIRDSSRRDLIGILLQTRPALGGNVMATIMTKNSRIQMATARPGVMKRLPADETRKGNTIRHKIQLSKDDLSFQIISTEIGAGDVNLGAEVIVSGGKGMQNRDNYEKLVGSLCGCLAGRLRTSVERAASRAAVEQGFVERSHQVGQTGTSIAPKIYLALGISGAIQHMIGVANAETIIAINSDPNAPIFKQCDYYIVGTIETVVPELIEALSSVERK